MGHSCAVVVLNFDRYRLARPARRWVCRVPRHAPSDRNRIGLFSDFPRDAADVLRDDHRVARSRPAHGAQGRLGFRGGIGESGRPNSLEFGVHQVMGLIRSGDENDCDRSLYLAHDADVFCDRCGDLDRRHLDHAGAARHRSDDEPGADDPDLPRHHQHGDPRAGFDHRADRIDDRGVAHPDQACHRFRKSS